MAFVLVVKHKAGLHPVFTAVRISADLLPQTKTGPDRRFHEAACVDAVSMMADCGKPMACYLVNVYDKPSEQTEAA